jgi:ribosome-associated protein
VNSIDLAKKIATAAHKTKALEIKILDLRRLSSFTDFYVICSGTSDRQLRAISDRTKEELTLEKIRPLSTEGYDHGNWILMDYPGVIFHIFTEESRNYYDLEGFWRKAPLVSMRFKSTRETKTDRSRKPKKPSHPGNK